MLYSALVFLLAGLIAVGLRLTGVVVVPTQISLVIFLIGVTLLVIQVVMLATIRPARVR